MVTPIYNEHACSRAACHAIRQASRCWSGGELGELARSFDTMRQRLRSALGEINDFTQSLETKVDERTEQLKAAHQKLLQTDRLASLGQLAAGVAHEINNPVNGVRNLSMLMQRGLKDDGIPPGRIEEFRKYLSQVTSETSRVGRIVSDILSFSRQSKPQRSEADLNQIGTNTSSDDDQAADQDHDAERRIHHI